MLDLKAPLHDNIIKYSCIVFEEIDGDGSGQIDFEEFSNWIKNSIELQDFLLKYTGVQTLESANRRFNEQLQLYSAIFDSISIEFMDDGYAQLNDIKKIMKKALKFMNNENMRKLFMLMDYSNNGAINKTQFMGIMRPWSCFSACDINNKNELDSQELKTLIWLIDGEEPDDRRV